MTTDRDPATHCEDDAAAEEAAYREELLAQDPTLTEADITARIEAERNALN
jgi:hypothetical protein